MGIHFISGKPGGGKSLYGTKLILEELRFGTRKVVTNLSLNLPRLNEYIQKTYPDENIDLHQRVFSLKDEECRKFWLYRRGHLSIERPWNEPGEGAFIVLDELHLFFNAREWMNTGTECLHYLSQHRKLGDDVICITQHTGNVDKQFRSVAQDFTLIVNGFKQRLGLFRGLPMFHRYTFAIEPNGLKQQPEETGHFRLDKKGIASCYDTAAGIGVHGRGADKGERKKGMALYWFPVIVVTVILAVMFGMKSCSAAFRQRAHDRRVARERAVADKVGHPAAASHGDAKQAAGVPPSASTSGSQVSPSVAASAVPAFTSVADRPVVLGKMKRADGRIIVVLSDGRTLIAGVDEEVERVQTNRVMVSGQWYYFKRPASAPVVGAASVEVKAVPDPDPVKYPDPPPPPDSPWQMHSDGVQRLKEREKLAVPRGTN